MRGLQSVVSLVVAGLLVAMPSPAARAAASFPGRTAGQADVSARGEATYSIPITVPPGTNGLTPGLALEYRHAVTGGVAGAGWAIGGLSAISRCARTMAQDGVAGPVTQTSADRFCLDGQRLVGINGVAYGSVGAEYRTEVESFARIRPSGTAGAGPQQFVVELADGRVLEYGATPDSRIDWAGRSATARAWALNRMRDRAGNVIDYAYTEDAANGSFRLASVRYNANPAAGLAATHEITFLYESRPADDVDLRYVAGLPVRQVTRLDRIDVLHQGEVLRRYELDYEAALSAAGRSRLASIRECGRGLQACLAPTTFAWQDGVPGLGPEQAQDLPFGNWSIDEPKRWWTADVNGDGRDDVVWAGGPQAVATLHFRLALASGGFGTAVDTGVAAPEGAGVPLDYDGDGIRDVLLTSPAGRWQVVRGTATGLGVALDTGIAASPIDFRGADLNGDGLSDLVYSESVGYHGNGLRVRVRYNIGGVGFSATPVTLYEQGYHTGYPVAEGGDFLGGAGQRIDLDGDGREDLLMNENYSVARISASEQMSDLFDGSPAGGVPADFNGDGCTDLAYPHHLGRWRVRFSGCVVLGTSGVEIVGPAYDAPRFPLAALDWNGDGKDDLFYGDESANWKVVLSTGDRLLPVLDTGLAQGSFTGLTVGDLDGDGLEDLVTRSGSRLAYRLHAGAAPDLLSTVRDGFGVGAAFTYSSLRAPAVYTRESGAVYPQRDVQDGRAVVAGLSITDGSGTGASRLLSYSYAGLRADLAGRGDLGFARRIVREQGTAGLVLEESYRQDFPFSGRTARHVVRRSSGAVVSDLEFTWQRVVLGTGAATRHHPYLHSSRDQRYEPAGASGGSPHTTIAMSTAAVDPVSGVVTDRTVTVVEGPGGTAPGASRSERVEYASVLNDTVNWCLGRPQSVVLTGSHTLPGGAAVARRTALDWDGLACRPVRLQLEPDSPQWQVTVDLAYDGFGNPSRRSVTGAGMIARTTTVDWGTHGRLPQRLTNPLSQSVTATWEEGLGVLASVSDPNGLTTRWAYDGFAQAVEEVRPDGVRVAWSRQPCTAACDPRARYRISEEERGPAGDIVRSRQADVDQFERTIRAGVQMPGGGRAEVAVEFDAWGRTARQYQPAWAGASAGGFWQYGHDDLGRLVTATLYAPGGVPARATRFDHDGLAVTQTDPRGHATTRRQTAWGVVASVTDALRGETRYHSDAFGRLTEVRDGLGNTTARVTWNVHGVKTAQWDTDLGSWAFGRNALGELVWQRDAKGQSASFEYDALGRVLRRSEAEGVTNWTWGNSAASRNVGRLASVASPGHMESYAYDSMGRLAARTIYADTAYRYDYAYDSLGRLSSLTYPVSASGFRLKVGYEHAGGQVVRVRNLSSAGGAPVWELGATDAAGNVLDESLGGALRVFSGYSPTTGDLEYRQAGAGGSATIQDLAYRWDSAGNLLERRDQGRRLAEVFSYDAAGRLEQAVSNGVPSLGLRYDLVGNIIWKSDVCPSGTDCFSYDAARRHAVIAAGANRFGYDANGNMVYRNSSTVAWYSYNLPRTITQGSNQSQFWYGHDRKRWKQVASSGGVWETTVYAGGLLEKATRSGKTTWRHYIQAPTGTAAVYLRHGDGSAPETYLLTHDHLGSIDRVVDAGSGAVVVAESFDPFGRRRGSSGSGVPGTAEWDIIGRVTRDGFTGHEHLDNVGLIHMNGRVYDATIGRFLSPDPIVHAPFSSQDLNRYSYAWNNPLSVTDPSGLEEVQCLHGPHGRCQGVTVTGLRDRPEAPAYQAWRTGSGGQAVSAAARDPCGQDGSAAACMGVSARSAAGSPPASRLAGAATAGGVGDFLSWMGEAALNLVPGWYYAGVAATSLERGSYVDAAVFYGAMAGDVFLFGRGLALGQAARGAETLALQLPATSFGPLRAGPLSDQVASTFRSASYRSRTLDEPLTVYRVIGESGVPTGRFWTTLEPRGALQSVIDLAIDQNWRNPATRVIRAELPAGTVIYEGFTSAQRGLVGGAPQIYLPRVDPRWLR